MAVIFEYTDRAGRRVTVDTEAALAVSGLGEDYRLARTAAGLGTEEELAAGLARVRRPAAA